MRRCIVDGSVQSDAMILDLSVRGVYIASPILPAVNDAVTIRFHVPGNSRQLAVASSVAWIQEKQTHPVHGLPTGFGARFVKIDVEDVRIIARAIQEYCLSNPIYRQYV